MESQLPPPGQTRTPGRSRPPPSIWLPFPCPFCTDQNSNCSCPPGRRRTPGPGRRPPVPGCLPPLHSPCPPVPRGWPAFVEAGRSSCVQGAVTVSWQPQPKSICLFTRYSCRQEQRNAPPSHAYRALLVQSREHHFASQVKPRPQQQQHLQRRKVAAVAGQRGVIGCDVRLELAPYRCYRNGPWSAQHGATERQGATHGMGSDVCLELAACTVRAKAV